MSYRLDPNLLAAYVDEQLEPEEAAKVEMDLAKSPEDRQAVENLREMNVRLASAFEAPLRAPLPLGLRRQLTVSSHTRRIRTSRWVATGSTLAASIALVAAYFAGDSLRTAESRLLAGEISRASALHELLESGRDGDATGFESGTAALSTTFLDGEGEPCRDFEWSGDTGVSYNWAIACRHSDGWVVEIAVSRSAVEMNNQGAYVPAAGARENLMAVALEALEAGPVLGPDEVELLLGSDWAPQ